MKKLFTLTVGLAIGLATASAQKPARLMHKTNNETVLTTNIRTLPANDAVKRNPELIKVAPPKESMRVWSMSPAAKTSSGTLKAVKAGAAVPDGLIGTFNCSGLSYWGGRVTGKTVITADPVNDKKVWVSNFIPDGCDISVYGIIASDGKTISFPQNQLLYANGDAKLAMNESVNDITGTFDATTGVITINSNLWGSYSSTGWYELFSGPVTYTRSDMMPPSVSYRQPKGALFLGLNPVGWNYYSSSCLIASPYSTWNWKNTNIEEGVSYGWSYIDNIAEKTFTSNVDSLLMDVDVTYYNSPILKATNQTGKSASYVLGADYNNTEEDSYIVAGGDGSLIGFSSDYDYGMGNQDYGFTLLSPRSNTYYFGTGMGDYSGITLNTLMVEYEKPQSPLYFEGVNVYLGALTAPSETPFKMSIILADKYDDGHRKKGKVVATKTIKAKDVAKISNQSGDVIGYSMTFSGFDVVDNDGFVVSEDNLEMDQSFYVELSGFNVAGVKLGVCSEELAPTDGESYSCFTEAGNDTVWSWTSTRQTMYMNLIGATYPYIELDKNIIEVNGNGGTYDIDANPYFDSLYFDNASLPNWIHAEIVNEEYSETAWGGTLRIKVDPIPNNGAARTANIIIKSTASSRKITVNQSIEVSAPAITNNRSIYASRNESGFRVVYPSEIKEMSVYSTTGTLVGKYNLPATGSYDLLNSYFPKGVYLLILKGDSYTKSIRISK